MGAMFLDRFVSIWTSYNLEMDPKLQVCFMIVTANQMELALYLAIC